MSINPYLNLLRRLSLMDRNWWNTCYVDQDGGLASHHACVHSLLEVLNTFVQTELSMNPVEYLYSTRHLAHQSPTNPHPDSSPQIYLAN